MNLIPLPGAEEGTPNAIAGLNDYGTRSMPVLDLQCSDPSLLGGLHPASRCPCILLSTPVYNLQ